MIYVYQREHNLLLHEWLRNIGLLDSRGSKHLISNNNLADKWLINSLPDALWMFALSLFILFIWNFKRTKASITWLIIALSIGLGYECLQLTSIIPGTFDPVDLSMIALAGLLPIIFLFMTKKKNR